MCAAKLEVVTARIHHLSNVIFGEEVVVGRLTFELLTNIERRVSENEIYFRFEVKPATLEMSH